MKNLSQLILATVQCYNRIDASDCPRLLTCLTMLQPWIMQAEDCHLHKKFTFPACGSVQLPSQGLSLKCPCCLFHNCDQVQAEGNLVPVDLCLNQYAPAFRFLGIKSQRSTCSRSSIWCANSCRNLSVCHVGSAAQLLYRLATSLHL